MSDIKKIFYSKVDKDGWYTVQLGKNINRVLPNNTMFELVSFITALEQLSESKLSARVLDQEFNILEEESFDIADIRLVVLEASDINTGLPMYGVFAKIKPKDTEYGITLKSRLDNPYLKTNFRLNGICREAIVDTTAIKYMVNILGWDYVHISTPCTLNVNK